MDLPRHTWPRRGGDLRRWLADAGAGEILARERGEGIVRRERLVLEEGKAGLGSLHRGVQVDVEPGPLLGVAVEEEGLVDTDDLRRRHLVRRETEGHGNEFSGEVAAEVELVPRREVVDRQRHRRQVDLADTSRGRGGGCSLLCQGDREWRQQDGDNHREDYSQPRAHGPSSLFSTCPNHRGIAGSLHRRVRRHQFHGRDRPASPPPHHVP